MDKKSEDKIVSSNEICQLPVPYDLLNGKENLNKNSTDSSAHLYHTISDNDLFCDNSYLDIGQGLRSRHTLG